MLLVMGSATSTPPVVLDPAAPSNPSRSAVADTDTLPPLDPLWRDNSCIPVDDLHAESLLPSGHRDDGRDDAIAAAAVAAYQEMHADEMLPKASLGRLLTALGRGTRDGPDERVSFIRQSLGGMYITSATAAAIVAAAERVDGRFAGVAASSCLVPQVVDVWNMEWDGMDMCALSCIFGQQMHKLKIRSVRDIEALLGSTAWELYRSKNGSGRACCEVSEALKCSQAIIPIREEAFVTSCSKVECYPIVQSIVLHSPMLTSRMLIAGAKAAAATGNMTLLTWFLDDATLNTSDAAMSSILQAATRPANSGETGPAPFNPDRKTLSTRSGPSLRRNAWKFVSPPVQALKVFQASRLLGAAINCWIVFESVHALDCTGASTPLEDLQPMIRD